jgi:hypothetical protein
MVTTIHFPASTIIRLKAEAEKTGKDIDTIVTEAVEARMALSRVSLAEAVRPIQEALTASGTSAEEAETVFEQELSAMRAERRSCSGNP